MAGEPAGSPAARATIGYLAELFRFPEWLRADELLALHQRLAGSDGGADERRELLELVGLADAAGTRVGAMSKGMQQRLGIAQALVGAPRLLMLDEPTSALDPVGRRVVRDLLLELKRRGVAVLLNSHLLSEVERVCDRVAILVGGEDRGARQPGRAGAGARGGGGVEAGVRPYPEATREQVPGDRGRAGRGRRARLRRARAVLDARGRPTSRPWRPRRERRAHDRRVRAARVHAPARVRGRAGPDGRRSSRCTRVGTEAAFDSINAEAAGAALDVDDQVLTGSTLLGLAMFTTLFLGCVLAVFLTLGAVRGDAERGLLQPLVVRPLGRTALLGGRFAAAAGVCGALRRRASTRRRW